MQKVYTPSTAGLGQLLVQRDGGEVKSHGDVTVGPSPLSGSDIKNVKNKLTRRSCPDKDKLRNAQPDCL